MSTSSGARRPPLRADTAGRLLMAVGALGSMPQSSPVTLDDFAGHEGGNGSEEFQLAPEQPTGALIARQADAQYVST